MKPGFYLFFFLVATHSLFGYTIHFVHQGSDTVCPDVVTIYIGKKEDSIKKYLNEQNRKEAGIIAVHNDVPRGNVGFRAAWNWKSIQDQYKDIKPGEKLFMTVVDKSNNIILLSYPLATQAQISFIVKKDRETGACMAAPVNYTDGEVQAGIHFPVGKAYLTPEFLSGWVNFIEKEKLPEVAPRLDAKEKNALTERLRGYKFVSTLTPL